MPRTRSEDENAIRGAGKRDGMRVANPVDFAMEDES